MQMGINKLLCILSGLLICLNAYTQNTQKGYVKTRGRLGIKGSVIKGTGVSDVIIKIKNGNSLRSQTDGKFSFAVKDWYSIGSVTKKGYVLSDPDVLNQKHHYTMNTPLYIVMDSEQERANEKIAIERNIRRTLGKQLAEREEELDRLRQQNALNEAEYNKRAQALYDAQGKQEQLIKDMVERYMKTDYDMIDSLNRRIADCILRGDLLLADSLIKTKGNLNDRISKYEEHRAANKSEEEKLKNRQKQLEESKRLAAEELERLAYDCYEKHDFFKFQHKHDSAAYYLDLRAGLDTTNLKWQFDVGEYVTGYLTDFSGALEYFERALKVALTQGEETEDVATCYNNIGYIKMVAAQLPEALSLLDKALQMRLKLLGDNHPDVALTYNFLGYANTIRQSFDLATGYLSKAKRILEPLVDEKGDDLVFNLMTTGLCYRYMGKYQEGLDVCEKGLALATKLYKDKHPYIGSCNQYIATIYLRLEQYDKAMAYYGKAIEQFKTDYGYDSPYLSPIYNDLGTISRKLAIASSDNSLLKTALDYYEKGIAIDKKCYGDLHPNLAVGYGNVANVYGSMGQFEKALKYIDKSLEMLKRIYGAKSQNTAMALYNKGGVYYNMKKYSEALKYKEEGLKMFMEIVPANHPSVKAMKQDVENTKRLIKQ